MRKFIQSALITVALLTSASAVMAAPRVHHQANTDNGFTTNSSEQAWKWWDDEAEHR